MSQFPSSAAYQLMSIMGTFVPWKQLFFLAADNLILPKRFCISSENVDMFFFRFSIIAWYCSLFGHLCTLLASCLLETS